MVNIMKAIELRRKGASLAEMQRIEKASQYDEERAADELIKELRKLNVFGKTPSPSYPNDIEVFEANRNTETIDNDNWDNTSSSDDVETTTYEVSWNRAKNDDYFLCVTMHITMDTTEGSNHEVYSTQFDAEAGEKGEKKPFTDIGTDMGNWIEEQLVDSYGSGVKENWEM